MTPVSAQLKKHLAQAYGMPVHLKAAFDAWIDAVDKLLVENNPQEEITKLPSSHEDLNAPLVSEPEFQPESEPKVELGGELISKTEEDV